MKQCKKCQENKDKTLFYKNKRCKDGLNIYCKVCQNQFRAQFKHIKYELKDKEKHKQNQKIWVKNNPSKRKNTKLKQRFNITLEDYNKLLIKQNESCAICQRNKSEFKKSLSVDHDHITGKIRGLLCFDCNTAIGKLRDNIDLCYKSAEYLKSNN